MPHEAPSRTQSFNLGTIFGVTNLAGELEQRLSTELTKTDESLQLRCTLEATCVPAQIEELSVKERLRLAELAQSPRYPSWLLGRAALKKLLVRQGLNDDTCEVTFPNKSLSLTHTQTIAIAMALNLSSSARVCVLGVGIDFEPDRTLESKMHRFFLQPIELEQLAVSSKDNRPLQLWTIKEALFKADPANEGRMPGEYTVVDVNASHGAAYDPCNQHKQFVYASTRTTGGFLSAAIAFKEVSHAQ